MSLLTASELNITEWPPVAPGTMRPVGTVKGVRILHLPTGIAASSTAARSQHKNRDIALAMLEAGLAEFLRIGS